MHIISSQYNIIFLLEALTNCNVVSLCLTFEMCVFPYTFSHVFYVNLNPFVFLKHFAVYQFMFASWIVWCTLIGYLVSLWILMKWNVYINISFSVLLIEKEAGLIDARTVKFDSFGNVFSLWCRYSVHICIIIIISVMTIFKVFLSRTLSWI